MYGYSLVWSGVVCWNCAHTQQHTATRGVEKAYDDLLAAQARLFVWVQLFFDVVYDH